ncbi:hypothetical protein PC116_g25474 [Phytophthora cactorum]|uniref:Uncharacterized protein n=1 Tax=Phytophthora cactorum TaxID=29920 RepID=A0A8T1JP10_9STRA|nr:hypothetical protein PC114_g23544 [Phytophthora cactorum]KAG2894914.1 hypothetical protein PC117_g23361 [Phytophthora cactorum]KAG2972608.1 hypothetical protein PC119_g23111 [Phytophthora cactorum]KAG2991040.1 hypothetical protein PC120_g22791 [Phytophthora cactorum]KAG3130151.1 hypothetical protein C6341_g23865 [Phytophthora cactorum]
MNCGVKFNGTCSRATRLAAGAPQPRRSPSGSRRVFAMRNGRPVQGAGGTP